MALAVFMFDFLVFRMIMFVNSSEYFAVNKVSNVPNTTQIN